VALIFSGHGRPALPLVLRCKNTAFFVFDVENGVEALLFFYTDREYLLVSFILCRQEAYFAGYSPPQFQNADKKY